MAADDRTDQGDMGETARVVVLPQAAHTMTIHCSECGAEIDRVKYTPVDGPPAAVTTVAGALGISEEEAVKLVRKNNPDALVTAEEAADKLAADIAGRRVADRGDDTYACPLGHEADLEVRK